MTQLATAQQFTPEERRAYIGASEIAAVMGLDKWRTPLDVYNEKLGLTAPFEGNAHTERGNELEAIAARKFTEITGQALQRRNQPYIHPDYPFIVGHIDRVFVGEKKLAEIKCPSIAAYRKYQRDGLPQSMIVQMQVYLGLTGFESGTWLVFCSDVWDLATFPIEFDPTIYHAAVSAAADFWNRCVITHTPPLSDQKQPEYAEIATVGGNATVRDDQRFVDWASRLKEAKQLVADAEELYSSLQEEGLDLIEREPGIYRGGCVTLHYKEQPGRVSFDKKTLAAENPGLDLSRYEKRGASFCRFTPYFTN